MDNVRAEVSIEIVGYHFYSSFTASRIESTAYPSDWHLVGDTSNIVDSDAPIVSQCRNHRVRRNHAFNGLLMAKKVNRIGLHDQCKNLEQKIENDRVSACLPRPITLRMYWKSYTY